MDENQNKINPEPFDSGRDALLSDTFPPSGTVIPDKSAKKGRSGRGGGFFKKIVRYIFISMFVISLITNFYLALLLSGGMTERVVFTRRIAKVVNWVLLAIIFFLVVTPVGLFFRVIGRDPLNRKLDPNAKTYWKERTDGKNIPDSMGNQF